MLHRVAVGLRPSVRDVVGQRVAGKIANELHLPVTAVRIVKIFTIDGLEPAEADTVVTAGILHDPVVQTASLTPLTPDATATDWIIEVSFRPGVTDNEARTARDALAMALELPEQRLSVSTAVALFAGTTLQLEYAHDSDSGSTSDHRQSFITRLAYAF